MSGKQRIWELDAFRGLCIVGMIVVHFIYDLVELYGIWDWEYPTAFYLLKNYGGILFILLSGACATLGSRSVRRGIIVFCCGMVCTAVTGGMVLLHLADSSIMIWFGVLHCLGVCMILWPLFRKWSPRALALTGLLLAVLGWVAARIAVPFPWLCPLGLTPVDFYTSDYFPLLPHFGYFLLGVALGRAVYQVPATRFPQVDAGNPVIRFFCFCGRQSLLIYLLHQPVLAAVVGLFQVLLGGIG